MLALWARYQLAALGVSTNSIHDAIVGDDGAPPRPPARATASQPSRSSRSFNARHQALPGGLPDAEAGASTPRRSAQPMNDSAARRNRRWRGEDPNGPS